MQLLPRFTQNSSIFSNKSSQCGLFGSRRPFASLKDDWANAAIQKKDGLHASPARIYMRWFVIVCEDHDVKTAKSQNSRHATRLLLHRPNP
jgi:hypothetical protein